MFTTGFHSNILSKKISKFCRNYKKKIVSKDKSLTIKTYQRCTRNGTARIGLLPELSSSLSIKVRGGIAARNSRSHHVDAGWGRTYRFYGVATLLTPLRPYTSSRLLAALWRPYTIGVLLFCNFESCL